MQHADAIAVLAELVELKGMKEDFTRRKQRQAYRSRRFGDAAERAAVDALEAEYKRRQPLAWEAAREIVARRGAGK